MVFNVFMTFQINCYTRQTKIWFVEKKKSCKTLLVEMNNRNFRSIIKLEIAKEQNDTLALKFQKLNPTCTRSPSWWRHHADNKFTLSTKQQNFQYYWLLPLDITFYSMHTWLMDLVVTQRCNNTLLYCNAVVCSRVF